MWRLGLRNLLRNKRRTVLTASSVAISLFLLSSLAMVYTALASTAKFPKVLEGSFQYPPNQFIGVTAITPGTALILCP